MADQVAGPSGASTSRPQRRRLLSDELREILDESDVEEEDPFIASDEDEYIPHMEGEGTEDSDAELEGVIEYATESESESDEEATDEEHSTLTSKDGTVWQDVPFRQTQTVRRNILRQRPGAANFSKMFTAKGTFKSIITPEICDIILRESNRKGRQITEKYNSLLIEKYPDADKRPKEKVFKPITEEELDAFLGILIEVGVHKSNRENLSDLWKLNALPLIRAAMSRNRFQLLLRVIRFDNDRTREARQRTDKAAPIRDIWTMFNVNLQRGYTPCENITVDEQLFPYRGRTKFTQYIPSKPAKYGIKIFWACDSQNSYPLQGQLYVGKPPGGDRQVNVGERTVLDLVSSYKGTGRNITTDNFFTTLELARVLNSWNMTFVGTVRRNKRFLPPNMQPSKSRAVHSTNFAFIKEATVCSYVPKRNKAVILLSTMHMTPQVSDTQAAKPEMILYYNKNKGGVDTMDKMLSEYTTKRSTRRWPLAFFLNMVDVAALAAYVIYMDHNKSLKKPNARRTFLKDLASQLCRASIQTRATIPRVVGSYFTKTAIEACLGHQIHLPAIPSTHEGPRRDAAGHAVVVGSCHICRRLHHKQRKTRKSCKSCSKPICDEHSVTRPTCNDCLDSSQ